MATRGIPRIADHSINGVAAVRLSEYPRFYVTETGALVSDAALAQRGDVAETATSRSEIEVSDQHLEDAKMGTEWQESLERI